MAKTPPSSPPAVRHPRRIGPYRIVGVLGSGGMGVVYDAIHPDGREVALKVVRASGTGLSPAVSQARFEREARILAELHHPGIVRLVEAGEADGVVYLAMEKIAGVSLLVVRRQGPLELEPLVDLGVQVAAALDHLHRAGVIHRDIKPANILVCPNGRAVVTDFGISGMSHATGITRHGDILGSPGFMAPEVVGGAAPSEAADQFALGRLLFELGARGHPPRLPVGAPLLEVLNLALEIQWGRFPTDGRWPEMALVLARMLADDPEERYPTAFAAQQALARVLEDGLGAETLLAHVERIDPELLDGATIESTGAVEDELLFDLDMPAGLRRRPQTAAFKPRALKPRRDETIAHAAVFDATEGIAAVDPTELVAIPDKTDLAEIPDLTDLTELPELTDLSEIPRPSPLSENTELHLPAASARGGPATIQDTVEVGIPSSPASSRPAPSRSDADRTEPVPVVTTEKKRLQLPPAYPKVRGQFYSASELRLPKEARGQRRAIEDPTPVEGSPPLDGRDVIGQKTLTELRPLSLTARLPPDAQRRDEGLDEETATGRHPVARALAQPPRGSRKQTPLSHRKVSRWARIPEWLLPATAGLVGLIGGYAGAAQTRERPKDVVEVVPLPPLTGPFLAPIVGPEPSRAELDHARALYVLARRKLFEKDLDSPMAFLSECIKAAELPDCHRLRGTLLALRSDSAGALASFERARELSLTPRIDFELATNPPNPASDEEGEPSAVPSPPSAFPSSAAPSSPSAAARSMPTAEAVPEKRPVSSRRGAGASPPAARPTALAAPIESAAPNPVPSPDLDPARLCRDAARPGGPAALLRLLKPELKRMDGGRRRALESCLLDLELIGGSAKERFEDECGICLRALLRRR